jgi:GxxExxY protein
MTETQDTVRTRSLDDITGTVVDAAVKIHRALGPGLLESVYAAVLTRTLVRQGFKVERQKVVRFEYDGMIFEDGLRIDLVVDDRVLIELKSIERLAPVHGKQVLTYLRLSNLQVGLLINFGGATLKEGLQRIVNNLPPSASPHLRVNRCSTGSLSASPAPPRDPWPPPLPRPPRSG